MADEAPAKRDYRFSDGVLIETTDDVANSLTRDLADLAVYGVTAPSIANLVTLRNTFDLVMSDVYMLSLVKAATANKDAARALVESKLNILLAASRGKFGAGSTEVGGLGIVRISRVGDEAFRKLANGAHQAAVTYSYTGTGVDAAFLLDLRTKVNDFGLAIDAQAAAVKNRDLTTRDRVNKGNIVYKELVRMADFGKTQYRETNEAKYNDYVLVESRDEAGNTLEGELLNNEKENLGYSGIDAEDEFTFHNTSANPYETYFTDTLVGDPVGSVTTIAPGAAVTFTALALGYNLMHPLLMLRNNAQGVTIPYKVVRG